MLKKFSDMSLKELIDYVDNSGINEQKMRLNVWTPEKIKFLKDQISHQTMTYEEMGQQLGLSLMQVAAKIKKIKIEEGIHYKSRTFKTHVWGKHQDDFLKSNLGKLTYEQVAKKIGFSRSAVYSHGKELGLIPNRGIAENQPFSKEDDDFILNNFHHLPVKTIARRINHTDSAVLKRYKELKRH